MGAPVILMTFLKSRFQIQSQEVEVHKRTLTYELGMVGGRMREIVQSTSITEDNVLSHP